MYVLRASTPMFITSKTVSGIHSWCTCHLPLSQEPLGSHIIVSQQMLCFSTYMSQNSTPANTHSCLFYICLSFLASRVVVPKRKQGTSTWKDQLLSFRYPNSQQVHNGFWSKARQALKALKRKASWLPAEIKVPSLQLRQTLINQNLKNQNPWPLEKFRSHLEFRIHIVTHSRWHGMILFTYFPQKQSLGVLG